MTPTKRARPRRGLRILALLLPVALLAPPRDLDVAVPPGSPTRWARAFPVVRPPAPPLLARSGRRSDSDEERSVSAPVREPLPLGLRDSFGLIRILTWDLGAHLSWLGSKSRGGTGPGSGRLTRRPPAPRYGEALYWITMAPLLRRMLHPGQTPEAHTIAHLVELGDVVLPALAEAEKDPSLRSLVRAVRERLVSEDARPDLDALGAETERERMLARFLTDELLRIEPYDPTQPFGARFGVLAEEVTPLLVALARDPAATTVRRNAVAALARLGSEDAERALAGLALEAPDAVCRLRALAAVGRVRVQPPLDWKPLVDALARESEAPERVAILDALARSGASYAVPAVLAEGKNALRRKDADVLFSALHALARLPAHVENEEVTKFLDRVLDRARSTPLLYRPTGPSPTVQADRPDGPRTRGRLLEQLAVLALVRRDVRRTRELEKTFGLGPKPAAPEVDTSVLLAGVEPFAQPLFLDTLGRLAAGGDEAAAGVLLDVARRGDWTELQSLALPLVPQPQRQRAARALLTGDDPPAQPRGGRFGETEAARLAGFEMLARDLDPDLALFARRLLKEGAELSPEDARPGQRMLVVRAIQVLEGLDSLSVEDLLPLLGQVTDREDAFGELPERVRREVRRLVDLAALGKNQGAVEEAIAELVGTLVRAGFRPGLTEETREEAEEQILTMLGSVRNHRRDPVYLAGVRAQVLSFLLGAAIPPDVGIQPTIEPPVLLERTILFALGRLGSAAGAELLLQVLENPRNRHRAAAALALGASGRVETAPRLARFLLDEDAWVRFSAYEALRHLTDREHAFVDWLFGPAEERNREAEAWWGWLAQRER